MAFKNCPFDITPYDKSNLVKSPNLTSLNYTNQDFWSMKSRLIDFIKEKFSDQFNDFVESDLALMLIENWAFIADTLSFKIDQVANEIFIDTVTEVDNAFRLSMLVGFRPTPPIGARSLWSTTIVNVLETDLVIDTPQAIPITTEDGPKIIELFPADRDNNPIFNQPIIIPAGSFLNTGVVGVEGETRTQTQIANGEINQSVSLSFGPVIQKTIRVQIDGVEWTQVPYFTDSQPRREFRVEYDPNYNAFVMFGNYRSCMIPASGSNIRITYRVGGGVSGNIVTGSIELQRNFVVPGFGFRVPVTFRNYTRGEFGYAGDTIDDIKRKLPPWLRTQNRAVTGDDYETMAEQFVTEFNGQVGKAKAALRNYGCAANLIDLYILSLDGENGLQESTDGLKNQLNEELENKKMITDIVCLRDGVVVETDVSIDCVLDKFYRKFEDELEVKINRRLDTFFSLKNWDYEKSLKAIDVVKALSDLREIRTFEINFITDDEDNSGDLVTTKFFEIIRPGTIEINFVYE